MKTMFKWTIAAVVAVIGFMSVAAWAQGEPGANPPPTSQPRGGHGGGWQGREGGMVEMMDKVVTLTPEQKTKLEAMAKDRKAALDEWMKANGDKVKTAREALMKAQESKDQAAIDKAMADLRTATAGRDEILKKYDPVSVLTPEQKTKWYTHQLTEMTLRHFGPAKLTDDQQTKVKAAAEAMVKEGKIVDFKTFEEALKSMGAKVEEMLTPEQKDAMKAAATSRPHWGPGGPGGPTSGPGGHRGGPRGGDRGNPPAGE